MSFSETVKEHGITIVGGIVGTIVTTFVLWLASEFDTLRTEFVAMQETVQTLDENSGDRYSGSQARQDHELQNELNRELWGEIRYMQGVHDGHGERPGLAK